MIMVFAKTRNRQLKYNDIDLFTDNTVIHKTLEGFLIRKDIWGGAKTTNFIYEVKSFKGSVSEVNAIRTRAQIRDRVKKISESGGVFEYVGVSNKQFNSNMKMIDTALPEFIAQMLLDFFSNARRTVADLTKELSENEKMKQRFALSLTDYEYKIKNLLDASALGMVPSKSWDGFSKAHGGYIIVKENGDVVCYHLYNRDEFRSYLYENTKFDTPSTSKYEYGELYEENGRLFFKLNLQIRFLK